MTERQDSEAQRVIHITSEIIGRAGNWADALDSALIDAGVDIEGVWQPDGSDAWEIVRYRAADGTLCIVYLADASSYRVVEEK